VFWFTPKGKICASEPALWLDACAIELYRNQRNEVRWFNGIGANDVAFIPKVNPPEEIFLKCESVKPLSSDKASIYKKWLEERISEIQSITAGTTRREAGKILFQNGGFSTKYAAVYSHIECTVLKARIEFEPVSDEHAEFGLNGDDKVKAVSTPYLGLFTTD
jgi:hypothetical protein